MGVNINIKVEESDSAEDNIETVINLITNNDWQPPESDETEDDQTSDEEVDIGNIAELFEESEEESEPELVCGGAYVLVRQRKMCGGQLRLDLPDHNTPDGT